jgi:hypothetical protein
MRLASGLNRSCVYRDVGNSAANWFVSFTIFWNSSGEGRVDGPAEQQKAARLSFGDLAELALRQASPEKEDAL